MYLSATGKSPLAVACEEDNELSVSNKGWGISRLTERRLASPRRDNSAYVFALSFVSEGPSTG
jgi:hypothetical protein